MFGNFKLWDVFVIIGVVLRRGVRILVSLLVFFWCLLYKLMINLFVLLRIIIVGLWYLFCNSGEIKCIIVLLVREKIIVL